MKDEAKAKGESPAGGEGAVAARQLGWLVPSAMTLGILAVMIALGMFVSARYRETQMRAIAETGAVYIEGFLAPLALRSVPQQPSDLSLRPLLDATAARLTAAQSFGELRIWGPDGRVIYSTDTVGADENHDSTELDAAFAGQTSWKLTLKAAPGPDHDAPIMPPYIEIYAPIRDPVTREIVAVGEIYQNATAIVRENKVVAMALWTAIGGATLGLLALQTLALRQGSALRRHLAHLRHLAEQNARLRQEAEEARIQSARANEQVLNVIGAELHDGPVQMLGLAALIAGEGGGRTLPDGSTLSGMVAQVLHQLRTIAEGLILPELERLSATEALRLAVARHEARTGSSVALDLGALPDPLEETRKTCLYRIVQEGLTNAHRHGDGKAQHLDARLEDGAIRIEIRNGRTGDSHPGSEPSAPRLGFTGMRRRLEAFGGTLHFSRQPHGAVLVAILPLERGRDGVS